MTEQEDKWLNHPLVKVWISAGGGPCPFQPCPIKKLDPTNLYNAKQHFEKRHAGDEVPFICVIGYRQSVT